MNQELNQGLKPALLEERNQPARVLESFLLLQNEVLVNNIVLPLLDLLHVK